MATEIVDAMANLTFENIEAQEVSNENVQKLRDVVDQKDYPGQAVFLLNAFWAEHKDDAEQVWQICFEHFGKIDHIQREEGHALNETQQFQFLQGLGKAIPAPELRKIMKNVDVDNDRKMSLLEFYIWQWQLDITELLTRPQGSNEELEKAQEALAELEAEMKRIDAKLAELQDKVENGGLVSRQRSKNEIAQIKDRFPNTEFNRLLVSAEAKVRKAQKSESMVAQGQSFWVARKLEEAKKYKPQGNLKSKFKA